MERWKAYHSDWEEFVSRSDFPGELVRNGAADHILTEGKSHLGTDRLVRMNIAVL